MWFPFSATIRDDSFLCLFPTPAVSSAGFRAFTVPLLPLLELCIQPCAMIHCADANTHPTVCISERILIFLFLTWRRRETKAKELRGLKKMSTTSQLQQWGAAHASLWRPTRSPPAPPTTSSPEREGASGGGLPSPVAALVDTSSVQQQQQLASARLDISAQLRSAAKENEELRAKSLKEERELAQLVRQAQVAAGITNTKAATTATTFEEREMASVSPQRVRDLFGSIGHLASRLKEMQNAVVELEAKNQQREAELAELHAAPPDTAWITSIANDAEQLAYMVGANSTKPLSSEASLQRQSIEFHQTSPEGKKLPHEAKDIAVLLRAVNKCILQAHANVDMSMKLMIGEGPLPVSPSASLLEKTAALATHVSSYGMPRSTTVHHTSPGRSPPPPPSQMPNDDQEKATFSDSTLRHVVELLGGSADDALIRAAQHVGGGGRPHFTSPVEVLSAEAANLALVQRQELEEMRRACTVLQLGLKEYEHAVSDAFARVGVAEGAPSRREIIERLERTVKTSGHHAVPPQVSLSSVEASHRHHHEDTTDWVLLLCERLSQLNSKLKRLDDASGPRVMTEHIPKEVLQQRYCLFRSPAASDGVQTDRDIASRIRSSVWQQLTNLEDSMLRLYQTQRSTTATSTTVQPASHHHADHDSIDSAVAALSEALPPSHRAPPGATMGVVLKSAREALAMHDELAAAALLSTPIASACISAIDGILTFPRKESTSMSSLHHAARSTTDAHLDPIDVDCSSLLRSIDASSSAGVFAHVESSSIPSSVRALQSRWKHFVETLTTAQRSRELEQSDSERSMSHCHMLLSKLLLPQQYLSDSSTLHPRGEAAAGASQQMRRSSAEPPLTLSELVLQVKDRLEAAEKQNQKSTRANEVLRAEKTRLEDLVKVRMAKVREALSASLDKPVPDSGDGGGIGDAASDSIDVQSSVGSSGVRQQQQQHATSVCEAIVGDIERKMETLKQRHIKALNTISDLRTRVANYDDSNSNLQKRMTKMSSDLKIIERALLIDAAELSLDAPTSETAVIAMSDNVKQLAHGLRQCASKLENANEIPAVDAIKMAAEKKSLEEKLKEEEERTERYAMALETVQRSLEVQRDDLKQALCAMAAARSRSVTPERQVDDDEQIDDEKPTDIATLLRDAERIASKLSRSAKDNLKFLQQLVHHFKSVHNLIFDDSAVDVYDTNISDAVYTLAFLSDNFLATLSIEDVSRIVREAARKHDKGRSRNATTTAASAASPPHEQDPPLRKDESGTAAGGESGEQESFRADHRLIRTHAAVAQLATVITAMLEVQYLGVGILAPEAPEDGSSSKAAMYVIGDVDPLRCPYSNETLLRTLEHNIRYLEDRLKRFAEGYKQCAIFIQRDVDNAELELGELLQILLGERIEEIGMDRDELERLQAFLVHRERRDRCYFVSPDGEPPSWRLAVNRFAYAFPRLMESLHSWADLGTENQQRVSEIVEAISGSTREGTGDSSTSKRNNSDSVDDNGEEGDAHGSSSRRMVVTPENVVASVKLLLNDVGAVGKIRFLQSQLERAMEELQLQRETNAVEEQRLETELQDAIMARDKALLERDAANSAASVARALLRRQFHSAAAAAEAEESPAEHQAYSGAHHVPPPPQTHRQQQEQRASPPRRNCDVCAAYEQPTFSSVERQVPRASSRASAGGGRGGQASPVPTQEYPSQYSEAVRQWREMLDAEIRKRHLNSPPRRRGNPRSCSNERGGHYHHRGASTPPPVARRQYQTPKQSHPSAGGHSAQRAASTSRNTFTHSHHHRVVDGAASTTRAYSIADSPINTMRNFPDNRWIEVTPTKRQRGGRGDEGMEQDGGPLTVLDIPPAKPRRNDLLLRKKHNEVQRGANAALTAARVGSGRNDRASQEQQSGGGRKKVDSHVAKLLGAMSHGGAPVVGLQHGKHNYR